MHNMAGYITEMSSSSSPVCITGEGEWGHDRDDRKKARYVLAFFEIREGARERYFPNDKMSRLAAN